MYRKIARKTLEWPKMAIPNFSDNFFQRDWYKFGMAKNGCSKFFSNNFFQKDWYKFGTTKNGCSKFFPTVFPKKTGINLEQPKISNFC